VKAETFEDVACLVRAPLLPVLVEVMTVPHAREVIHLLNGLHVPVRQGVPPRPGVDSGFALKDQHGRAGEDYVVPRASHRDREVHDEILADTMVVHVDRDGLAFRAQGGVDGDAVTAEERGNAEGAPGAVAPPQSRTLPDREGRGRCGERVDHPHLGRMWMQDDAVVRPKILERLCHGLRVHLEHLGKPRVRGGMAIINEMPENGMVQRSARQGSGHASVWQKALKRRQISLLPKWVLWLGLNARC